MENKFEQLPPDIQMVLDKDIVDAQISHKRGTSDSAISARLQVSKKVIKDRRNSSEIQDIIRRRRAGLSTNPSHTKKVAMANPDDPVIGPVITPAEPTEALADILDETILARVALLERVVGIKR